MKYKIGYKKNGLWRYIMLVGNVEYALKMVEELFTMECDQVTIKLLNRRYNYGIQDNQK